jgi:SAM-dependent methyltransferase
MFAPRDGQSARNEPSRVARTLGRLLLYVYLPLAVLIVALHFPYATDGAAAPTPDELTSARSYYEAAYRPEAGATRGLDYEQTAAEAAKKYNIEGHVRDFVARYQLSRKRVLDVGSGRGYLQDVVADYTGLDLSPEVASHYHKPFVVGSATNMPFLDNTFDAAWTIWVLEHIPTPQRALEEMRRVVKDGGVLYLAPAWNCPTWLADGFEVRRYDEFNLAGKLVKATIPLRSSLGFTLAHVVPIRLIRMAQYRMSGDLTPLRFRRLQPNYDVYWQPDSDAAVSLDSVEARLWFESRGDICLSCEGPVTELLDLGAPLVIQVRKS